MTDRMSAVKCEAVWGMFEFVGNEVTSRLGQHSLRRPYLHIRTSPLFLKKRKATYSRLTSVGRRTNFRHSENQTVI
jgi:hypothetical protein